MPKTLTIELPDEIYEGLQKLAEKWKTTPERIAADWVVFQADRVLNDPLEKWIGAIPMLPWADRHDELFAESLLDESEGKGCKDA
jgi:hypothetical protein